MPRVPETNVAATVQSRRTLIAHFRRSSEGATAIEFGIVAAPFFALLLGTLEVALAFWSTQVLETAVSTASRQVYTGQFQTANPTSDPPTPAQKTAAQAEFKRLICEQVRGLFDCNAKVSVDVRAVSSFLAAQAAPPVTGGQFDPSGYSYDPPKRLQIAIARASLEYPVYVTKLCMPGGTCISMNAGTRLNSGNRLITATAVFRTEPF
jgi:Flp pilus assembly pilin Flp